MLVWIAVYLFVSMRRTSVVTLAVYLLDLVSCAPRPVPTGIVLELLRRGPDPFPDKTDADGLFTMTIQSKEVVRIRGESVRMENLGRLLEELFRTREERLVLLKVDGQVPVGDMIEVMDQASSLVQLSYLLMTGRSTPTPAEPSLFLHGKPIHTQYFVPAVPEPVLHRRSGAMR